MHLKTIIKTDKGDFEFSGTMSSEEERVVYEAGLNYLLRHGALPMAVLDPTTVAKFAPGSDSEQ